MRTRTRKGNRAVQAIDCLSLQARIAEIAARNGLRRNLPGSVAKITGGEYLSFKDARSLERGLVTISNDIQIGMF